MAHDCLVGRGGNTCLHRPDSRELTWCTLVDTRRRGVFTLRCTVSHAPTWQNISQSLVTHSQLLACTHIHAKKNNHIHTQWPWFWQRWLERTPSFTLWPGWEDISPHLHRELYFFFSPLPFFSSICCRLLQAPSTGTQTAHTQANTSLWKYVFMSNPLNAKVTLQILVFKYLWLNNNHPHLEPSRVDSAGSEARAAFHAVPGEEVEEWDSIYKFNLDGSRVCSTRHSWARHV